MAKKILSKIFSCAISGHIATAGDTNKPPITSNPHTFSSNLMQENIAFAESIITKWNPSSTQPNPTHLFADPHDEPARFLRAVSDLRRAMIFFSDSPACDETLIRAQTLMHTAMTRLEGEFSRILSANPKPDAVADLRAIAESMMANGYGMECVRIYKSIRKSHLEETLFLLGFDLRLPHSNLNKIDWPILDLRIKSWLIAARIAFTAHFIAERNLCNKIFDSSSDESCFNDLANGVVLRFLSFPYSIAKTKPSLEKLFPILELHQTISDLLPQIESTFSSESIKSKTLETLQTLAQSARDSVAEFEIFVQKESSKIAVHGGGIHPLIYNSMKYLVSLSNYIPALINIFAGIRFRPPEPLPEISLPCESNIVPEFVSERIAWIVLIVLCKLDHKAEFYKEVSISYLFLANNVQYVVDEVNGSDLRMVLGGSWVERHENIARNYMEKYVRVCWEKKAAEEDEGGEGEGDLTGLPGVI